MKLLSIHLFLSITHTMLGTIVYIIFFNVSTYKIIVNKLSFPLHFSKNFMFDQFNELFSSHLVS